MANNLDIKDAAAATKTVKSTDNAGVHTPHHNVDVVTQLPVALGANGGLKVEGIAGGVAQPTTSSNFPAAVDTNSGSKSASTLRMVLATDQPTMTNAQPVSIGATARTASLSRPTTSGTVSSGAQTVAFANVGSANGTVASTTLKPGETVEFVSHLNDTLGSIAYNPGTSGEFLIAEVR